jgi:NADPH-dependent curcumin reductase CurA
MPRNKGFILESRPTKDAPAGPHNFKLIDIVTGDPADGQVLVRNHLLSLDPYKLGEVMGGGTVGEVVASGNAKFRPGDPVVGMGGWQLFSLGDGRDLCKIETDAVPVQSWLGALGMPGVTAWYGLNKIIAPNARETVVVSAATGAVGTVVGQLAKIAGARAVGIAGGPEKCAYAVGELGYDICVDHRAPDFADQLTATLSNGVDGLFENVGGEPFSQTIRHLNPFARIAICGLVASGYDGTPTPMRDVRVLLDRRARMEGFIVSDHMSLWPQALRELAAHAQAGKLRWRETIAEGLEAAPEAFFAMLKGGNFGKQLVKLV